MLDVDAERVEVQLTRFEREAQATASLRSPHTINLYDFGRSEDGAFYYVMEFLDGLTLQQLVERFGPVPPERAAFLLAQACDSLADAHHASLLHRDIKPANIIVSRFGRRPDHVHVLDFGLVKAFAPVAADTEAAKRLAEAAQLTHDKRPGRHTRVHLAGIRDSAAAGRRPFRPVFARLRGVLAGDRPMPVRG